MKAELLSLLQTRRDLWQGDQQAKSLQTIASGFDALDSALPGAGWPLGSLTELMPQNGGIGELSLLLPVISRITRNDEWVALIAPPVTPYAPALGNAGVDLNRLLILQPNEQRFWAAEQLLRSGLFKVVIIWADASSNRQQRRLQLAAESGRALAVCYRPFHAASEHSAAALRLTLQPQSDALLVDIIKTRHGGKPCQRLIDNQHFFNARTLH